MKQWLISKIPTWVLRHLVNRNFRRRNGVYPDKPYWADLELCLCGILICPYCYKDIKRGEQKHLTCWPVGFPEWLAEDPESYGYKDELDDRFGEKDD